MDKVIIHIVEPPVITVVIPEDRPKIHVQLSDVPPEITLQERVGAFSYPTGEVLNSPKAAEKSVMSGVVIVPMDGGRGPTVRNGEALTTGMLLDLLITAIGEGHLTSALQARLNLLESNIDSNDTDISSLTASTTSGINTAQSTATSALNKANANEAALVTANLDIDTLDAALLALTSRVTTAESDIDAVELTLAGMVNVLTDITTLQTNQGSLTTRVGVTEGNIAQHTIDIAALDAALTLLSTTANDASTKADNIELEAAGWTVSFTTQAAQLTALEDNFAALEAASNKVVVRSISASDTAVAGEFLQVDCSAGNITVTLPDPTDPLILGMPIWIRKSDVSRYKVLTSVVNLAYQNTTLKLICNGTDWVIS